MKKNAGVSRRGVLIGGASMAIGALAQRSEAIVPERNQTGIAANYPADF
jgi:hypothetical protein